MGICEIKDNEVDRQQRYVNEKMKSPEAKAFASIQNTSHGLFGKPITHPKYNKNQIKSHFAAEYHGRKSPAIASYDIQKVQSKKYGRG